MITGIFDLKIHDFLLLLKHRSSHHSSCYHVFINFFAYIMRFHINTHLHEIEVNLMHI